MEQYIDKSALVAEIMSRISDIEVLQKAGLIKKRDADKKMLIFKSVLSLIDTLEVKEVELETELNKYIKNHFTIDTEQLDRFGIEEKDYMYSMDKSDMLKMIRYFTNNYKVPASNDLEEAAKLCVSDSLCITNEEDWDDAAVDALNIFKAGAKWQKKQMLGI